MKISLELTGFDDFRNELFHICKLFYEEVEWWSKPQPDLRIQASLASDAAGTVEARVALQLKGTNPSIETTVTRLCDEQASTEERRRVKKRAAGAALLQALQKLTGISQPWGILTGVRPMKLLHQMLARQPLHVCARSLGEEYLLSEEKIQLLTTIAQRQQQVIPDLFRLDQEVSLYVGIPFCPTKCAYCTFPAYDIRGNNGSVSAFLTALHDEIHQIGGWLQHSGLKITTVYIGGGTPTSIDAQQLERLLHTMAEAIPGWDKLRELTVEAGRPDTITADKIRVMKAWEVSRISINPQTFVQSTLDSIGRHHSVSNVVEAFALCRQLGMDNINMDLILGLPGEGLRELELTLAEVGKLQPESLTIHALAYKKASRITQTKTRLPAASHEQTQKMMKKAAEWATSRGYHPYYMYRQKNILGNQENVGYSLSGCESLYNILMMEERQTIIGLGCGAVSKIISNDGTIQRFPNPKEPAAYCLSYKDNLMRKLRLLEQSNT